MILKEHTFNIFNNAWKVLYNTDFAEEQDLVSGLCHVGIENTSNDLTERFFVVGYRFGCGFSQYFVEVHKNVYDESKKRYVILDEFVTLFNVKASLLKNLANQLLSNNAEFEENAKMLSRIISEIAAGKTVKHDIIPFDQDADMTPIQPLIFTLETTNDSVAITVENAENSSNVETSIDGGSTWGNQLSYGSLAAQDYTILVKERESIVLSQKFTIE